MEAPIVSGVTHDASEAKITIERVPDRPGIAASVFRRLADEGVNVDMIVQNVSIDGHADISFTVPMTDIPTASDVMDSLVKAVGGSAWTLDDGIGRVSIIGAGMRTSPGVAAMMFEVLAAENINIEMISTSTIRLSCVVRAVEVERAVQALHAAYGLAES
jgi:aspartate kinase